MISPLWKVPPNLVGLFCSTVKTVSPSEIGMIIEACKKLKNKQQVTKNLVNNMQSPYTNVINLVLSQYLNIVFVLEILELYIVSDCNRICG